MLYVSACLCVILWHNVTEHTHLQMENVSNLNPSGSIFPFQNVCCIFGVYTPVTYAHGYDFSNFHLLDFILEK